jgi:16S rRNA (adenine1518-N6/adenine1519-N6)-dimethyltransferase
MKRPKLGQHFLRDRNMILKIVRHAGIAPSDTVLEVGAGEGFLTRALADRAREVFSLEVDGELFGRLKESLREYSNIRLECADALTYPYALLPHPFKVVANLPYYIATPLIFRFFELRNRISEMVIMLQQEVAMRLVAPPGSRTYGPLSVAAQYYSLPRMAFRVPRRCFSPPPRVDSAVVRMEIRGRPAVEVKDEGFFFRLVRGAFAHRRKVLRNSLMDSGLPKDHLERAAAAVSLDLGRRAETLTLQEFASLSDILFELGSQNMIA